MKSNRSQKTLNIDSAVAIRSAFEVDESELLSFYAKAYHDHANRLDILWKWLYRPDYNDHRSPIVAVQGNTVIGHAGLIPFRLNLYGTQVSAAWFVDFSVDSNFQKQGIGQLLTERWMEYSDVFLTYCNDRSMRLFKKYGWIECFDTNIHYYILQPNHYPAVHTFFGPFRQLISPISLLYQQVITRLYRLHARNENSLIVDSLNDENVKWFVNETPDLQLITPIRDYAFLRWRFLESPDRHLYLVIRSIDGMTALAKKKISKSQSTYIDILLLAGSEDPRDVKCFLATLLIWANKQKYAYVRAYYNKSILSRDIRKTFLPLVKHPRFAFFSHDKKTLDILGQGNFYWQLADSDFEFIS